MMHFFFDFVFIIVFQVHFSSCFESEKQPFCVVLWWSWGRQVSRGELVLVLVLGIEVNARGNPNKHQFWE